MERNDILLTPDQAAERLGVGINTVYDLLRAKRLPAVYLTPKRAKIPAALLEQWAIDQALEQTYQVLPKKPVSQLHQQRRKRA